MNYYGALILCHKEGFTEKYFLHHSTAEMFEDLRKRGFIDELGRNGYGDTIYTITKKGEQERDKE